MLRISNEQIIQHDPILRLLCLNWKLTNTQIILFVSSLSGLLFIVIGGIANSAYKGPGRGILAIDNIGFILTWLIIFAPLMWSAYLWQARVTPALIMNLVKNGVLGSTDSSNCSRAVEQAHHTLTLMCRPFNYLIVALALIVFWLNEFLFAWPEQFRVSLQYWYEVRWYLPIHILAWSISLYALFLLVLRQVVFVLGLPSIFRKAEVEVKPLHPDDTGGFGVVGKFIKSSIWFVIGIGFIAVLFALEVYLTGANILHRTDVLALFGLYVALVPFCLLIPLLSAHGAMLHARERMLQPIAREFQETLEVAHRKISEATTELKELDEKLEQIKKHREIVLQVYPTSPLPMGVLRNFSITATIPFISGVASVAIQMLTK